MYRYQERFVDVEGARLSALHLKLPNSKGVMFYLHGKSTGRIESEAQLKSDVRRAWDTIAPLYAGKHKVIVGRSRGTDLAAAVAAEIQPDLTVLLSPSFSMAAVTRE